LHHENLNSVAVFYDEITVQVNYYLTHKPSAVYEDNSFLYQQIRQKIGDKIIKSTCIDALNYYEKSKRLAALHVIKRAEAQSGPQLT